MGYIAQAVIGKILQLIVARLRIAMDCRAPVSCVP